MTKGERDTIEDGGYIRVHRTKKSTVFNQSNPPRDRAVPAQTRRIYTALFTRQKRLSYSILHRANFFPVYSMRINMYSKQMLRDQEELEIFPASSRQRKQKIQE